VACGGAGARHDPGVVRRLALSLALVQVCVVFSRREVCYRRQAPRGGRGRGYVHYPPPGPGPGGLPVQGEAGGGVIDGGGVWLAAGSGEHHPRAEPGQRGERDHPDGEPANGVHGRRARDPTTRTLHPAHHRRL
jgi:hypothetical protein